MLLGVVACQILPYEPADLVKSGMITMPCLYSHFLCAMTSDDSAFGVDPMAPQCSSCELDGSQQLASAVWYRHALTCTHFEENHNLPYLFVVFNAAPQPGVLQVGVDVDHRGRRGGRAVTVARAWPGSAGQAHQ